MTTTFFERAACKGLPTEVFFPEHGRRGTEAIAVCKVCPVITDCLRYHVAVSDESNDGGGVWGGTTERERKRMRRSA